MAVTSVFLIILLVFRQTSSSSSLIRQSIYAELVKPWDVKITSPEYIHLGLVMAGVSPEQAPEQHYLDRMEKMLRSTISYSQGTSIHLVLICHQEGVEAISKKVEATFASMIMRRLLLHSEVWKMKRYKIPKLRVEFVDMFGITDKYRSTIDHMKTHFNNFDEYYKLEGKDGVDLIHPSKKCFFCRNYGQLDVFASNEV